jgi:hypothetical protein
MPKETDSARKETAQLHDSSLKNGRPSPSVTGSPVTYAKQTVVFQKH